MKTLLVPFVCLLAASVLQSQDIIEEALRVTPPGFTDLVPRQDRQPIVEKSATTFTFTFKLEQANTTELSIPSINFSFPEEMNLETLMIELNALRKENIELKRRLSEMQNGSR